MIQSTRLHVLVDEPPRASSDYVLYWMHQSQRAQFNPSLEYAIEQANALGMPLVVCFGLIAYLGSNARQYAFMLQGLAEVRRQLESWGICFVVRHQAPDDLVMQLSDRAAMVVMDRGYLRPRRAHYDRLQNELKVRSVQVEGDVVVPIDIASSKHEFAARTLRPKIYEVLDDYIQPLRPRQIKRTAGHLKIESDVDLEDIPRTLANLGVDTSVQPVSAFRGGQVMAWRALDAFMEDGVRAYGSERARPESGVASRLSPYLRFGHISPVEIALRARQAASTGVNVGAYLEQLIVRRELAVNHVFHEPLYDSYKSLPAWAQKTLEEHAGDPRPHVYSYDQFEDAETHDPVWNAAMTEMRLTGYMHNTLRMYWGKMVLQWSASPHEAWETLIKLNDRWFLDGRSANGFANVGWIFGLHDRPWAPRPVFGLVRAMGANSLKKFDSKAYVRAVKEMAA